MNAWEISDEFWTLVEPLIPKQEEVRDETKEYKRNVGAGRKPKYDDRTYFSAILYVLRTGIVWNALPREKFNGLGSSALHYKFLLWVKAGLFYRIWEAGLCEHDELKGIAWKWRSSDEPQSKAPLTKKSVESDPTDQGTKWEQMDDACRREWRPDIPCRRRGRAS